MVKTDTAKINFPGPLKISLKLFGQLEDRGVKHCHWKSNQHLDAALAGLTDIDMLIAKEHAPHFFEGVFDNDHIIRIFLIG